MRQRGFGRLALLCLAGLGLFSLLFSLAAERGLWPELSPGLLHDTDLWAGMAGGLALLMVLLARGFHSAGGSQDRGSGEGMKTREDGQSDSAARGYSG